MFQEELRTLFSTFYGEEHPLVLPTPREDDAALGNWTVRHPINGGAYGKVVMVTHKISGEPAAVKIMWRRTDNAGTSIGVDREVAISRRMMGLSHVSYIQGRRQTLKHLTPSRNESQAHWIS